MTSELEPRVCRAATAWSRINPEYDYILFNDTHAHALLLRYFGKRVAAAWECITIGAVKADVWRLLAVYIIGGFYFDMDAGPKATHPFRSWGTENLTMVSGAGATVREPHQWGMLYAPRHPLIELAIKNMLPQLIRRSQRHVQDIAYRPFQRAFTALQGHADVAMVPGWGDCFGGRVHFKLPGGFDAHLRKTAHVQHWSSVEKGRRGIWKSPTCC